MSGVALGRWLKGDAVGSGAGGIYYSFSLEGGLSVLAPWSWVGSDFVGVPRDVSNAASGLDDVMDGALDGVLGGVDGGAADVADADADADVADADVADAAAIASSRANLASWNIASQSGWALVLPS